MTDATKTDDELQHRAKSAVGKVLRDKWRLDRVLGIGGMAAVFGATHRNGKRGAVKVLHPEAALAPTVKDRFLREGYLANKVDHPGAVSILDDDVDVDGTVFLVMELLEGETLDMRLGRSAIPMGGAELLQIVEQVLDCLAAAHDKGIVHRDLKPANLFITDTGSVKILDFGIARLEEIGQVRPGSTGAQTLGTPGFMPPEQARGRWEEVDPKSDLWAMGAVMFAALTGKLVHEAPTVNEQLLAAMTLPAEPLREVVEGAPEALAAVVDRALSFAKQDRWPNARAMRDAVRSAYETLEGKPLASARRLSVRPVLVPSVNPDAKTLAGGPAAPLPSVTTARPVANTRQGSNGRSRNLAIGLVAALAVVVVGAVGMLRESRPPPITAASPGVPGPASLPVAVPVKSTLAPPLTGLGADPTPTQVAAAPAASASSTSGSPGPPVAPREVKPRSVAGPAAPRAVLPTAPRAVLPTAPRAAVPTVPHAAAPAPSAAPAAPAGDVDLFTKRR